MTLHTKQSLIAGAIVLILILIGAAAWVVVPRTQQASIPERDMYVAGNLLLGTDATTTRGTYLIGFNGMTLYEYAKDLDSSNCTGTCAKTWPPYIVPSKDVLANVQAGIPGMVSSVPRADGSMQVTYDGHPLYFYTGDSVSGDMNGEQQSAAWSIVSIPATP